MRIKKLKNGLTVVYFKRKLETVAVNLTVNVGSNDEPNGIKGISHFIEHMIFEGTEKRPTSLKIASEIENLGGEFNAFTNNERTSYYIKIPKQFFKNVIDVLSDISINSSFINKFIKKEKGVVLNEIGALYDDPRLYQWVLFEQALYKKAVMKHPVIGYKKDIKNLKRSQVISFFKKYYHPKNMVLTIVGDVKDPFKTASSYFTWGKTQKKKNIRKELKEPKKTKQTIKIENRKLNQAYLILGYHAPLVNNKDSTAFEVIRSILGRGFSGTLFEEIRNKRGLAYDLGVYNESKIGFGYLAIYTSIKKKNINKVTDIINKEIKKLDNIKKSDLENAKRFLKGEFLMHYEDNTKLANYLCFLEIAKSAKTFDSTIKDINKIQTKDIVRVRKKYLNNPTIVVLK